MFHLFVDKIQLGAVVNSFAFQSPDREFEPDHGHNNKSRQPRVVTSINAFLVHTHIRSTYLPSTTYIRSFITQT